MAAREITACVVQIALFAKVGTVAHGCGNKLYEISINSGTILPLGEQPLRKLAHKERDVKSLAWLSSNIWVRVELAAS